jgi:condensin complex subunit 1
MNKLLDSVSSSMGAEIEAAARDMESDDHHLLISHKTPLEMYAFLINWTSSAAEAVKIPGGEEAAFSKPRVRVSFSLCSRCLASSREGVDPRPLRLQGVPKRRAPGAGWIKSPRHWLF